MRGRFIARTGRRAFSLIELMVAMALTLFIMVILTQAFMTSLETFSALKAIGELQANLRTASSIVQADLAADHFEGKRRLSSPDLLTIPPRQGFFYIYQGSAPIVSQSTYVNEGGETTLPGPAGWTGLNSWRASNHVLYFTIKLRGNRPENYMTALLPAASPLLALSTSFFGQAADAMYLDAYNPATQTVNRAQMFASQWAEICYFLVQTGSTVEPNNPNSTVGTPLYALYRAQYLMVMNPLNNAVSPATPLSVAWPTANSSDYYNISSYLNGAALQFNAPDDLANPANTARRTLNAAAVPYPTRASDPAHPAGTPPNGATLVLSSVTSFQVQVFTNPSALSPNEFTDLTQNAANFPAHFDSANNAAGLSIQALKVTIRIWDATSQMSRQITVIQDM